MSPTVKKFGKVFSWLFELVKMLLKLILRQDLKMILMKNCSHHCPEPKLPYWSTEFYLENLFVIFLRKWLGHLSDAWNQILSFHSSLLKLGIHNTHGAVSIPPRTSLQHRLPRSILSFFHGLSFLFSVILLLLIQVFKIFFTIIIFNFQISSSNI